MKLIDNILNDYFTKCLVKDILYNIRIRFCLDTKVEYEKHDNNKRFTEVKIMAKPKHYKNYTSIYSFLKGDSLNHLTNLKCSERDYITEKIKKIDENNLWTR